VSAFTDDFVTIHHGDAWELAPTLAPQSIHTIVTSPPYWGLRDYGEPGQFGFELNADYIEIAATKRLAQGVLL
jgi:site-specific DNA-methyltransferase (cytosine-N4-specific)